jgi:hypothetical protein
LGETVRLDQGINGFRQIVGRTRAVAGPNEKEKKHGDKIEIRSAAASLL